MCIFHLQCRFFLSNSLSNDQQVVLQHYYTKACAAFVSGAVKANKSFMMLYSNFLHHYDALLETQGPVLRKGDNNTRTVFQNAKQQMYAQNRKTEKGKQHSHLHNHNNLDTVNKKQQYLYYSIILLSFTLGQEFHLFHLYKSNLGVIAMMSSQAKSSSSVSVTWT